MQHLTIAKSDSDTSGSSDHDPKPKPYTDYQLRQLKEADPFQGTMLNEIFKPIMAMDKLSVLRRDRACFEILLNPCDLKALSREKQSELLAKLNQGTGIADDLPSDDAEM